MQNISCTREQAKQELLEEIRLMNKPLDEVFMVAPQVGKCSWTVGEVIEAIENDAPLEGCDGDRCQMIDMHIRYANYRAKKRRINLED